MNKRTFDLIVGVAIGVLGCATGARLWSTRYLLEGKSDGPLHVTALITKAVTG
jgi:hypothetical protein